MESSEVLAIVGGHVEEEILLRNEYLAAENEILKSKLDKRLRLTRAERVRLAKIGKRLGRKALAEVGCIVKPDTLLKWFRELVAEKFDGSKKRRSPGRPTVDPEIEKLVLRFAEENPGWGYDRIQGALANLGYEVSDETVGNILRRNGISTSFGTARKDFFSANHSAAIRRTVSSSEPKRQMYHSSRMRSRNAKTQSPRTTTPPTKQLQVTRLPLRPFMAFDLLQGFGGGVQQTST
jgi:hypothetical protein